MKKLYHSNQNRTAPARCVILVTAALLLVGLSCSTTLLNAATATFRQGVNGYTGTADTHLNANAPAVAQGGNATVLTDNDNPVAHGLLMFTNIFGGGPGQVPLNATIISASLTIRTDNVGNQCNFHRMLIPWDENATWNSMTAGLSADDVELASTIEFSITGGAVGQVDVVDVTAIVQGWFAGTFPNHGWGSLPTGTDGWQYNSSEHGTVDNRPLLTIVFDAPCSPVSIVTQPTGGMVNEGGSFTFSVVSAGTDLTYQWFKDDVAITDATNANYAIPFVRRTDEGNYRVLVNNPCSGAGVSSSTAFLDVVADMTPPALACAFGSNDTFTVFIFFTEAVSNALAATSYSVTPAGGGDNLQVDSAAYAGTSLNIIALTLNATTPMAAGVPYNVTVSAVEDLFGNAIVGSPTVAISRFTEAAPIVPFNSNWRYNQLGVDLGTGWRERLYDDSTWSNGLAILAVEGTAHPPFATYPVNTTLSLTPPGGGSQVTTYYFRQHFTHTGPAGFAVIAIRKIVDDGMVIHVNGSEVHRSNVPANQTYATFGTDHEADHIDDYVYVCASLVTGDNVVAVEVHQVNATSSDIVMGVELSAVVARLEPIVITQQPVGGTINEGDPFTLRVGVSGTNPRYQWFLNGSAILDATNSTYVIPLARDPEDEGTYHVVVQNDIPSMAQSANAVLNITADTTLPTILCAYFSGTNNDLVVVFSEIVTNALTADDPFRYEIVPGDGSINPTILSSSYTSGTNFGTTVTLVLDPTTPRVPGITYDVNILPGIADRFGNAIANNTLVPVAGFPRLLMGLISPWRYNSATNLGTTWIPKLYNDSAWSNGVALFDGKTDPLFPSGYTNRISLDGQPVNTHITISNETSTVALSAVYFRTHFNYSGSPSAVLCIRHFVDDGVVYYLNGVEILRYFMPGGVITNRTLATRTEGDANFEEPVYACVSNLMAGDNVLAAEVHQVNIGSSDITFGAELSVLQLTPPSSLTITHAAGGQVNLRWSGPGGSVLEAASSVTGPWSSTGVNQSLDQTFAPTGTMRFFRVREP